jgi:virulence-associated protein VagC
MPVCLENAMGDLRRNGNGRTARIFMSRTNQAVRIPREFEFLAREVFIRREGEELILSVRPRDWCGLAETRASNGFMQGILESESPEWSVE